MIKYENCRLEFEPASDGCLSGISEEGLFESIEKMQANLTEELRENAFRESRSLAFAAQFVVNA